MLGVVFSVGFGLPIYADNIDILDVDVLRVITTQSTLQTGETLTFECELLDDGLFKLGKYTGNNLEDFNGWIEWEIVASDYTAIITSTPYDTLSYNVTSNVEQMILVNCLAYDFSNSQKYSNVLQINFVDEQTSNIDDSIIDKIWSKINLILDQIITLQEIDTELEHDINKNSKIYQPSNIFRISETFRVAGYTTLNTGLKCLNSPLMINGGYELDHPKLEVKRSFVTQNQYAFSVSNPMLQDATVSLYGICLRYP